MKKEALVIPFSKLRIEDVPIVGGKNASLGEMYSNLTKKNIAIPNGFATTALAYNQFIKHNKIKNKIRQILKKHNVKNIKQLNIAGQLIRNLILKSKFPKEIEQEIIKHYKLLSKSYKTTNTDVAVRSSATAEDLPDASFAGQQETYLNIKGEKQLLIACKKCIASLFTNRAIFYRETKKFNHFDVALSIGIQKMVRSDKASSGVMFTIDTETGFKNAILINASLGLGENIVKGKVNPDEYIVFKQTLNNKKYTPILSKKIGNKKIKMIYNGNQVKDIKTTKTEQESIVLTNQEILTLAKWGKIIEDHYTKKRNKYTPMDIEWAKDGITKKLFIVQARPETVQSNKDLNKSIKYKLLQKGKIITTGSSVGNKIGQGKARIINNVKDISQIKTGEVLITPMTDPDWVPAMKKASAIVTNQGGRSCHAAIVSRELGIPCIVGTKDATTKIKNNQPITIDCASSEIGYVYNKLLKYNKQIINLKTIPKTKTQIMLNIGDPQTAFTYSSLPVKGVGLARLEFIINSHIQIHPLALIHFNKLKDKKTKQIIANITKDYKDKKEFFIDKLSQGVATIAAAFYPHDVIVRLSDFKSNEYANLIGGKQFEPIEHNPMLGWRGASRYYDKNYKNAFKLECLALKRARETIGLTNIKIMIPMCRTVEEGKKVLKEMKQNGLIQHKNNLQVYVMCELPSNVVLADQFLKIFDGFSIGSNDLTQTTLGLDRDSEIVSKLFNERNDAVKFMVSHAIKAAKKAKKKIGICGDAPSTYKEFATFLVKEGINSISLSPDAVIDTIKVVAKAEKN
jgi:pyruvate, water dikinase